MPATIKVDIDQIKSLISQVSLKEKEALARYLDDLTLKNRFKRLIARNKNIEISDEAISKEVEKVRKKRYNCGR